MANYDHTGSRSGFGPQRATVKWFNGTKGFGFVTLDDGSDAFCHASALATLGAPDLPQGATVYCEVAQGPRGMQVTTVHSVDLSTADPHPPRGGGGGHGGGFGGGGGKPRGGFGGGFGGRESGGSGPMGDGHVKFFNEQKGFGFVVPESGGADVYVHASALRRSGVQTLMPEQKVRFSTRQGMKGVEVDRIEVA
jgi:CspA family cold shock protein